MRVSSRRPHLQSLSDDFSLFSLAVGRPPSSWWRTADDGRFVFSDDSRSKAIDGKSCGRQRRKKTNELVFALLMAARFAPPASRPFILILSGRVRNDAKQIFLKLTWRVYLTWVRVLVTIVLPRNCFLDS